jgi:NAD(P)H-dependent FMN reductase
MTKLIAISGSLRQASYNTKLLKAAAEWVADRCQLTLATIAAFPLYNGDLEAQQGVPQAVNDLKEQIARSDGLVLATPEYNNSIPGVLKNAIDWLSRPPQDISRVWHNKPIAIMGATPGRAGTILAQDAWLPILKTLNTLPYFGNRMMVSKAGDVFDEEGKVSDENTREQLEKFMTGFLEFIKQHS